MTDMELAREIVKFVSENPEIKQKEIADIIKISPSHVAHIMSFLQEIGLMWREGGKKYGKWFVCSGATSYIESWNSEFLVIANLNALKKVYCFDLNKFRKAKPNKNEMDNCPQHYALSRSSLVLYKYTSDASVLSQNFTNELRKSERNFSGKAIKYRTQKINLPVYIFTPQDNASLTTEYIAKLDKNIDLSNYKYTYTHLQTAKNNYIDIFINDGKDKKYLDESKGIVKKILAYALVNDFLSTMYSNCYVELYKIIMNQTLPTNNKDLEMLEALKCATELLTQISIRLCKSEAIDENIDKKIFNATVWICWCSMLIALETGEFLKEKYHLTK